MDSAFLEALDSLRGVCGFPFIITSGYRSPNHSIERAKASGPGMHSKGIAADIKLTDSVDRFILVSNAIDFGFSGIGIAKDFIHLDMRDEELMWVY